MRRTVTNTADRIRTLDLLEMDADLQRQTPVKLPKVVLVEDIAACLNHGACLAVAVSNPHGAMSDEPAAVLHILAGAIHTWTGNYAEVNCVGFRPGGVDFTRRAVHVDTAPATEIGATVAHPRTGRPIVVHRVDRTLTTIGVRYADDTYAVYPRTKAA
ncbi:hypothetical protein Drose_05610 [Dactylosporangium roseum]|uniref:Uncharacterized protein n=1 Tax=Dactylosporangium roseum TaxID=47989 RepID=A0ABY5Z6S1_9ACTN|nr:hypothetical protein [Dactylosporangium roseum]UWZ37746.1 hypothetical protein Drose_05610 [Dactylosporangium roseum]